MALITPLDDGQDLAGVLGHRPELAERYATFFAGIWREQQLPQRLLHLCRARIGQIHRCAGEIRESQAADAIDQDDLDALGDGNLARFSEPERAALRLAELIPFGHHDISDALVQEADIAFGHSGCVTLLTALAFFDVQCRLRLTWGMD